MCHNLFWAVCVFSLQLISHYKLCEIHPTAVSHPKPRQIMSVWGFWLLLLSYHFFFSCILKHHLICFLQYKHFYPADSNLSLMP